MNKLEAITGLLKNFKPSYNFIMHNANGEVGRLDFNGPKLIFTGDAEESAKAFLDWLALSWGKRLQEEREAEREACAKVCEEKKSKYDERVSKSEDERDIDPEVARIAKMTCDFNAAAIRARGEV